MKATIYNKKHELYEEYVEKHGDEYSGGELVAVAKIVFDIYNADDKDTKKIHKNSLILKPVGLFEKEDGSFVMKMPECQREIICYPVEKETSDFILNFIIDSYNRHKKQIERRNQMQLGVNDD